jgi:hypothetical protein
MHSCFIFLRHDVGISQRKVCKSPLIFQEKKSFASYFTENPFGWKWELNDWRVSQPLLKTDLKVLKEPPKPSEVKPEPQSQPQIVLDDKDLCKICMENPVECAIVECGHTCLCLTCAAPLKQCPVCRQPIVKVLKLFKS